MSVSGIIGQITWYTIIDVYNALPVSEGYRFPGTLLRIGSRGEEVRLMQEYLNAIGAVFPVIPPLTADGVFGQNTYNAVTAFQSLWELNPDGVVGRDTWDKITYLYENLPSSVSIPPYSGVTLRPGSRGGDVMIMQKYLNDIRTQYASLPAVGADGMFGPVTEAAVKAFQSLFDLNPDGVIGRNTWNQIVSIHNQVHMDGSLSAEGLTRSRKKDINRYAAMLLLESLWGKL